MNYKKRAVISFVGAMLSAVGAIIMFSVAAQGEARWEYPYDEDLRSMVSVVKMIGWMCVILGVVNAIEWIVFSLAKEENAETETAQKYEKGAVSGGVGMPTGTMRCTCCDQLMSSNASNCPHCGVLIVRSRQENLQADHSASEEKNAERACVFCGEPMTERQIFCGVCGRRQDEK